MAENVFSKGAQEAINPSRPNVPPPVVAPIEQWVNRVRNFSSQYDTSGWSANQVIGPPTVYPEYGDNRGAWAQENQTANEYIEVTVAKPVYVERMDIYETYNCGAVMRIIAIGPNGQNVTLWQTDRPERITTSRIFTSNLSPCTFKCGVFRLELDCTADPEPDWCEIDAIKIYGRTSNIAPPPPQSALGTALRTLVNNKEFSDVIFRVETATIQGHRSILAARSTFFRALFLAKPDSRTVIPIPNISVSVFLGVLQYLYTNTLDSTITHLQLVQLVRASKTLSMPDLAALCDCYIQAALTAENVISIFKEASQPEPMASTRGICLEFCRDNFAAVAKSPEFATLPQHLLVELAQNATAAMTI